MTDETVYVALLDEGLDVWRPVKARRVARDTYEILEQEYDRGSETWAFEPGTVVECQRRVRDGRKVLIATKAVDRNVGRATPPQQMPVWEGHLQISLVSCPVRLFSALSSESGCLAGAEGDSIELESFVNQSSIETFFLGDPYYLTPSGIVSEETFRVLLEAMRRSAVAALSSIPTRIGAQTFAVFAGKGTMRVHVLRSRREVLDENQFSIAVEQANIDDGIIKLARELISLKEKEFTPPERFAGTVRETALTEGFRSGKVVSLADALRKSIKSKDGIGARDSKRSSSDAGW